MIACNFWKETDARAFMTSYRQHYGHRFRRGVSLIEMMIATTIIAITASAAIMTASSVKPVSIEPAVWQVEESLQFARGKAMSSSLPVVVRFDIPARSLRVMQRDFSTVPPTDTLLNNPTTKRPYDIQLFQPALLGSSPDMKVDFKFDDLSSATEVGFLENGAPGKLTSNNNAVPLRNPYQWRGDWQAVMGYKVGDKVAHPTGDYSATTNHNSATVFDSDLNKGFWTRTDAEAQVVLNAGEHRIGMHVAPFTGIVRIQAQTR